LNKSIRVLLVIINIVCFCALGVAYYYVFDLDWGINLDAIVWGLPFLVVMAVLVVFTIFLFKKQNKEKNLTILLLVVNILSFCVLGRLYYYAFDIQWGVDTPSITWGLPVLGALVFLVTETIFMLRKQNWTRGLRGFGAGWAAYIYIGVLAWFFSSVLLGTPQNNPKVTGDTEENRIMTLVIEYFCGKDNANYKNGQYVVVDPRFSNLSSFTSYLKQFKNDTIKNLQLEPNYNQDFISSVNSTFDRFLGINESTSMLSLKSSPEEGYYIDYDGKFANRTSDYPTGWERWRVFHHNARSSIQLSVPAYDPESGIIVVHIGFIGDYLVGSGQIIVFKLEDGKLKPLAGSQTWVA
jgi:hypothetical protein